MGDCNTFREELALRYPTLGHALWQPNPGVLYDVVEVGDVGLIRGGRFHRLFNALSSVDHLSDEDAPELDYPRRLQPRTLSHIDRIRDYQKDFLSRNITKRAREPNIHALG
ncbi:hypothetical protein F5148DRAFT_990565 [Russula earlei]|uniref:Uncharacterized protein n=1 Tax=Russula earlei TaxID=71964 RepID=A0ACC0TSA6_9AGAM|nr:hypothetical protein F5148DRAFT_990565 [Russula earlei]